VIWRAMSSFGLARRWTCETKACGDVRSKEVKERRRLFRVARRPLRGDAIGYDLLQRFFVNFNRKCLPPVVCDRPLLRGPSRHKNHSPVKMPRYLMELPRELRNHVYQLLWQQTPHIESSSMGTFDVVDIYYTKILQAEHYRFIKPKSSLHGCLPANKPWKKVPKNFAWGVPGTFGLEIRAVSSFCLR